jgi:putative SOS response-associated peptidase YedK
MCGRYSLSTPGDELAEIFDLATAPVLAPRYNIAPTQLVAVIRRGQADAGREVAFLKWGLVPSWAKAADIGARLINARAETVAEKPAFRSAFKGRRCLVLADGFFEWQKVGNRKQPFFIHRRDHQPFAFAGLWERWQGATPALETCTLITTEPNELLAPIHTRMPVILEPGELDTWIDPALKEVARLAALLKPYPAELLVAETVSTRVNNPANDDAACVVPVGP